MISSSFSSRYSSVVASGKCKEQDVEKDQLFSIPRGARSAFLDFSPYARPQISREHAVNKRASTAHRRRSRSDPSAFPKSRGPDKSTL